MDHIVCPHEEAVFARAKVEPQGVVHIFKVAVADHDGGVRQSVALVAVDAVGVDGVAYVVGDFCLCLRSRRAGFGGGARIVNGLIEAHVDGVGEVEHKFIRASLRHVGKLVHVACREAQNGEQAQNAICQG